MPCPSTTRVARLATLLLLPLLLLPTLGGCSLNPFTHHYVSLVDDLPPGTVDRMTPPDPEPTLLLVDPDDVAPTHQRLRENGFVQVGAAAFRGGQPSRSGLRSQARRAEADAAVWTSKYSHTATGTSTTYVYQPGRSSTSFHQGTAQASAYGSGGYATGFGSYSGSTTTRTQGTLVPRQQNWSVAIHDHGATFWRRTRPGILGASVRDIPSEIRGRLGRNTGAYVELVVNDGPAFHANLLTGDVIVSIEGRTINSPADLTAALGELAGRNVRMTVLRGGATSGVAVTLNERPTATDTLEDPRPDSE
jgi:hypothetical protein